MDEMNGVAPTEHATFEIGNQTIKVPALTFWDLQETKPLFDKMEAGLDWRPRTTLILEVLAFVKAGDAGTPEVRAEMVKAWAKAMSYVQASNKTEEMNTWLRVSGFKLGEDEAATENPGIGTLTPSSQDSPPEDSMDQTPS